MNTPSAVEIASLRFDGERFKDHALDVECTQELVAYRNLVLECAKALWRAKHPQRAKLPKRFEESFRLQFDHVEEGSALIPLQRVYGTGEQQELLATEFDEAVELIDLAIAAADEDALLPQRLPAVVIPLFRDFGRTLRDDEVLYTRGKGSAREAPYTPAARKRLSEWMSTSYEDTVDITGEVRMANLGPGRFALLSGTSYVEGRFSPADETKVLRALHDHRAARLRVRGIGEFGTVDRQLKRLVRVDWVELAPEEAGFDPDAPAIWDQLDAIGRSLPSAWDGIPSDLSEQVDAIVYGKVGDRP